MFGRTIHLVGDNDNRAEDRIRGLTLAGAYADEMTLLHEQFYRMLRTRMSVDGAKLFGTTNPDNPLHWLKKTVLDRATELGFNRYSFRLDDNPGLPPAYVKQLKTENTGLFYQRYIDGLWVAAEGAIYSMLDLEDGNRCSWDDVPYLAEFILGVDYGTAGITHAVLIGVPANPLNLPAQQKLYVVGEWRWDARAKQQQLTDAEQAKAMSAWLERGAGIPRDKYVPGKGVSVVPIVPHRTAVDPSAVSLRRQMYNDGWPGLVNPEFELVIDGIRVVSSLMGADRLVFVKDVAPELEEELMGYVWDEKQVEQGKDAPLKQHDHGVDALRYGITSCSYVWRWWLANGPS
jgi:hypothetical protein